MKAIFERRIIHIAERKERIHVSGAGPDATFREITVAWAIHLGAPDHMTLVFPEKPDFQENDRLKVTVEKA